MSCNTLTFCADGHPKPKGSLRFLGRGRVVEQVDNTAWKDAVTIAAAQARDYHGWRTLTGVPVVVMVRFVIPRPKSVRRLWPITRSSGDVDKLARLILDALTKAGIYADDSQVVHMRVHKEYPPVHRNADIESTPRTGAWILVAPVKEAGMESEPGADAHDRIALIRSIVSHSKDDEQALDEVRAVLAGAGIDDLLVLRGGAA